MSKKNAGKTRKYNSDKRVYNKNKNTEQEITKAKAKIRQLRRQHDRGQVGEIRLQNRVARLDNHIATLEEQLSNGFSDRPGYSS